MVQFIKLFKTGSLAKILYFFLTNPRIRINQRDIMKKLRISKATLIKHLNFLTSNNIIKFDRIGATNLYRLNMDNATVKQLKVLNNILMLDDVHMISKKYGFDAYLFGSAARGEDVEDSDIDILAICKTDMKSKILQEFGKASVGREIKPVILSPVEWSAMARKDKAFYDRVEKDKVKL